MSSGQARPGRAVAPSWDQLPEPTPVNFKVPPFEVRRLKEGELAVVCESHSTPLLHIQLAIPVGASSDPQGKEGLAGLSLPMMRDGVASGRDLSLHSHQLEAWRSQLTAEAGWDFSYLGLELLTRDWEEAVDLIAQIATVGSEGSDSFDPEVLGQWQQRRRAQLEQRRHSPTLSADDAIARILYGESPYGRCSLGTESGLSSIQRQHVSDWHRWSQGRPGWTWILTGPVHSDRVFRKLEGALPGYLSSVVETPAAIGSESSDAEAPSTEPTVANLGLTQLINDVSSTQAEVRLATATVPLDHPDFLGLQLLSHVLGGGFGSRLSTALRERRGLAYKAFSRLEPRRGPSPWMASAAVAPRRTGESISLLRDEVERLRRELIPARELDAAKDSLIGLAQTALRSGRAVAGFLQHGAVHGLLEDLHQRYDQGIRSLDRQELQRLANLYLPPSRLAAVVLGPAAVVTESLGRAGEPFEKAKENLHRVTHTPPQRDNEPSSRGAATYSNPKGGEGND